MTWLLLLYPPRWRRRYGREFAELMASQPFSVFTVIDVVGGAIDAWTRPQAHLAADAGSSEGGTVMLARMLRVRCGGNEVPTTGDSLKGAAVMLAGTVVVVLVARWLQTRSVDPVYPEVLMSGGWLFAFVASMPFWTLKGWPARLQAIFMGGLTLMLIVLLFGGAWLNAG
jgi:hypothetical protein